MYKFAIRLLTLAMFAMASAAVYVVAPAKAATENGTTVKKKHKKSEFGKRADAGSRDLFAVSAQHERRSESQDQLLSFKSALHTDRQTVPGVEHGFMPGCATTRSSASPSVPESGLPPARPDSPI